MTKATTDTSEDAKDDATFVDLEDEVSENIEMNDATEDEADADEIDPLVEASDADIVAQVALEADEQDDMPKLTHAEINLGRFTVTKVSYE